MKCFEGGYIAPLFNIGISPGSLDIVLHSDPSWGQAGIITLHLNISDQPTQSTDGQPCSSYHKEWREGFWLKITTYIDLFSKMIDIVTMLVNKFFRSCFLSSDLFRAAWAARDWADVLHVTRAQAGAGVNSLKCPHCVVSALTASTIQIQTRVRVPHVSSSGSRSTCRWSIHRSLWQHMSWLAFDTEKAELQIKLILLFYRAWLDQVSTECFVSV